MMDDMARPLDKSPEASTHRTVQELLPWFVMDTLDDAERAMVQAHLQVCTQCRADTDWQRKLRQVDLPRNAHPDVERALARLRPRLDGPPHATARNRRSGFFYDLFVGNRPWMPWALAAQFVVIASLAILLVPSDGELAAYRVLGADTSAGSAGNLVVIFQPDTTERDMRRILQANGARVVDGPTVSDAYVLAVADTRLTPTIDALRAEPAVVLAEQLDAGGAR